MSPRMINSPHVRGIVGRIEVAKDGTTIDRVLTVETDLPLDASAPNYDANALDDLVSAVADALGDLYDRADIVGPRTLS